MTSSMYSFLDVFFSGSVVTCTKDPAVASEHCNPAQESESPASRETRHAPALDQLERGLMESSADGAHCDVAVS